MTCGHQKILEDQTVLPTVSQTNSETEQVVCVQSEENSMPPNKRPCAGMKIKKSPSKSKEVMIFKTRD